MGKSGYCQIVPLERAEIPVSGMPDRESGVLPLFSSVFIRDRHFRHGSERSADVVHLGFVARWRVGAEWLDVEHKNHGGDGISGVGFGDDGSSGLWAWRWKPRN